MKLSSIIIPILLTIKPMGILIQATPITTFITGKYKGTKTTGGGLIRKRLKSVESILFHYKNEDQGVVDPVTQQEQQRRPSDYDFDYFGKSEEYSRNLDQSHSYSYTLPDYSMSYSMSFDYDDDTIIETSEPSTNPSVSPSDRPSISPTMIPSESPSERPTVSASPTISPRDKPSTSPSPSSNNPSAGPTEDLSSNIPSLHPTTFLSPTPTSVPSSEPSTSPTKQRVVNTFQPSVSLSPTVPPTKQLSNAPTNPETSSNSNSTTDDPSSPTPIVSVDDDSSNTNNANNATDEETNNDENELNTAQFLVPIILGSVFLSIGLGAKFQESRAARAAMDYQGLSAESSSIVSIPI